MHIIHLKLDVYCTPVMYCCTVPILHRYYTHPRNHMYFNTRTHEHTRIHSAGTGRSQQGPKPENLKTNYILDKCV